MRDWYWNRKWLPAMIEFLNGEPDERGEFVKWIVDTVQNSHKAQKDTSKLYYELARPRDETGTPTD